MPSTVAPIQNIMDSYDPTQNKGFGPDLSSFFDTSFDPSSSLPTDSFGLPALSYSHAFARTQDALLSSPLGLSPLSGSPFDFSYDPNSPLLAFGSEDEGTPELGRSTQLPSLFYDGPEPNLVAQSPVWAPMELAQPASLERTETSISPAMMRLDSFGVSEEVVVAAPTPAKKARKVSKRNSTSPVDEEDEEMTEQQAKDKFTGTRNTKIPPIDFTAPTMSRSYIIPSITSRKRAPAAITAKLTGATTSRKRRRASTPLYDEADEGLDPAELPDELLSAIELKRRQNTLAARRSRMRKAGHLQELQGELATMTDERDEWRKKAEELEAVVRALRGC